MDFESGIQLSVRMLASVPPLKKVFKDTPVTCFLLGKSLIIKSLMVLVRSSRVR